MAYDVNTMFFSGAASAGTSGAMDFHGPDLDEINYRFVATGVTGTITPSLETSDDGTTFAEEKVFPEISEDGEYINAYRCKKRYRRMKLTGGSATKLEAGIDSGRRYVWREPPAPSNDDNGEG